MRYFGIDFKPFSIVPFRNIPDEYHVNRLGFCDDGFYVALASQYFIRHRLPVRASLLRTRAAQYRIRKVKRVAVQPSHSHHFIQQAAALAYERHAQHVFADSRSLTYEKHLRR